MHRQGAKSIAPVTSCAPKGTIIAHCFGYCVVHTANKQKSAFPKWQTLIWWAGFTQYPLWHGAQLYISLSGNQTTTMRLPRNYVLNSPKFGTFLAFNLWNLFQELCFRHLHVTNISLSTPEHFHYTRLLRYKGATALTAIILLKVDK